jgi:hypothetical protein
MRKSVLLAPILALGLSTSAWAQQGVMTSKDRPDSVKVTVTFDADIDWVARLAGLASIVGVGSNDGVTTLEASAKVGFWVEFTEKVSFLISFANQRPNGPGISASDTLGLDGLTPRIWDLQIKVAEFLTKNVTVTVGTANDIMFDVRGKGSSWYAPGKSSSFGTNASDPTPADVGPSIFGGDTNTPAGVVFHYTAEGWTGGLALLPAVIEGGVAEDDEAAYFAWLYYDLARVGTGSRLGFLLATNNYSGSETDVRTIGIGATLKDLAMVNSEIFVNIALNNGDAGQIGTTTLTAKGVAFEVGFNYLLNPESQQWVEISLTSLSGDGDDSASGNEDIDTFLGYVYRPNGLLVVEDPIFGMDWNTNLQVIKISGGMSFTQGAMKNNVNVTVTLGLCSTVEEIGPSGSSTDKLGTEIDIRVVWWHSKAVAMDINFGYLTGSDILEDFVTGDENNTAVFSLGWRIQG